MKITLIILVLISEIYSYSEVINLKIMYSHAEVSNYTLNFNNYEDFLFFNFDEIRVIGKLCFASNYTNYIKNCKDKLKGYNSRWVKKKIKKDNFSKFFRIF